MKIHLKYDIKNERVIYINNDKTYMYALDLAMEKSGVVIFNEEFEPVLVTTIKTRDKDTHGVRLKHIEDQFKILREKYPVGMVAIERGFSRFPTSTQVIYRAHGVVNKFFHDVDQVYYPPKKVKEVVTGNGAATKKTVQDTIIKKYPNIEFSNEDESDAFAVGLTYLISNGLIEWDKREVKKKRQSNNKRRAD